MWTMLHGKISTILLLEVYTCGQCYTARSQLFTTGSIDTLKGTESKSPIPFSHVCPDHCSKCWIIS